MRRLLAVVASALLFALPAHAETFRQPDLLSFSAGYNDFDKSGPNKKSADFRFEYRWGVSLLPLIAPSLKSWDTDVQFHPFLGFETTSRSVAYGLGGFNMDWMVAKHWVFTWNEGVGLYDRGDSARLGSYVEFRSQAEFGYRFNNEMRITAALSHISNAGLTHINPGAEILGVYFHIPTRELFGHGKSYATSSDSAD
jgi:hypothetical protein